MSRLAFVTNICPHYRVRTFETLAQYHDIDYYFFSSGDDWYWIPQHGVHAGRFQSKYVPGFRIDKTRVTPTLPLMLLGGYDAYIKCINGRVALPLTYLIARLTRKPFILWTGIWMRLQTRAHRLFWPVTRYIYRHADAVVVYGDHVKTFLEREGVATDRIFVAAHAVDNAEYNRCVDPDEIEVLHRSLNLDDGAKVILYLGRLEEGKGLPFLLKAFAALERTDCCLVLAGVGSELRRLKERARELGVSDRVRFPGYVAPAQTVAYYGLAWVYVLPSVTTPTFKEPWGLVVNEAFNQGVPVIASDAVGAAAGGLIKDGVNGYVVPERDVSSLVKALQSVLSNPVLRKAMSDNARSTIEHWDNDRMVSGFRQALEYAIGATSRVTRNPSSECKS